ncbi:MAG TPA: 50S ribosomal protein L13 [Candidatus Absconditabacterales bacterium]|nr:50S ribosomal protein L13 [Candidatus Absconditabacterales bacterium]
MEFTSKDLNKTLWVKQDHLEKKRNRVKMSAAGQHLGRLATQIADRLMGKNYAHYCDFWDTGDFVVLEDVEKVIVTGNKLNSKFYHTYSGYKGNVKSVSLTEMMKKSPEKAIWFAVRGMLPKNKLRDPRMKRLKLFIGKTDKYNNLNPQTLN